MNQKIVKLIFPALIAFTLFSLWAGFALLIVNKLFFKDLPGYTKGKICIWEFVAIAIAGLIARVLIKQWGNIEFKEIENREYLMMNPKFGIYFAIYFSIAIFVGIWQFWLFSQNY